MGRESKEFKKNLKEFYKGVSSKDKEELIKYLTKNYSKAELTKLGIKLETVTGRFVKSTGEVKYYKKPKQQFEDINSFKRALNKLLEERYISFKTDKMSVYKDPYSVGYKTALENIDKNKLTLTNLASTKPSKGFVKQLTKASGFNRKNNFIKNWKNYALNHIKRIGYPSFKLDKNYNKVNLFIEEKVIFHDLINKIVVKLKSTSPDKISAMIRAEILSFREMYAVENSDDDIYTFLLDIILTLDNKLDKTMLAPTGTYELELARIKDLKNKYKKDFKTR